MTPSIEPMHSVYALVEGATRDRMLVNHRRTMLVISHEIENTVLIDHVRARLFSGFQRMSRFLPQVARYQQLAAWAESIYVFGVMDVVPPPIANVTYVPLPPGVQLAREWFLVMQAEDYFTTLATEEIGANLQNGERRFRGLWSFDEAVVDILYEWLSNMVEARPMLWSGKHNYQRQVKRLSSTMGRLTARMAQLMEEKQPTYIASEVQAAVQQQLLPAIDSLNPQS